MSIERELKLAAPPGYHLPALDGLGDGIVAVRVADQDLRATYYDTPDLRLARWGVTLRHRTGDEEAGWTLKLPADPEGHVIARHELSFPGPNSTVPAVAAQLVRAYVRESALARVARLTTRRGRVELRNGTGEVLALVCDDEVSVYEGRRLTGRFRELEVEVESPSATTELIEAVAESLRRAGATRGDAMPKLVRALGPHVLEWPEVPNVDLGPGAVAGDVVRAAIAGSVARLMRHDPGVRVGDDPEDLHQARVATRRLRSDLRTFRPLLDAEWATELSEELRWVGGLLGAVRDADVMTERLSRQVGGLTPVDPRASASLFRRLGDDHTTRRTELMTALDGPRYVALLGALLGAAAEPMLSVRAGEPALPTTAALVRGPWRQLESAVKALGDNPPDEQLHRVRIQAKRARYAADAAAAVWGKPARRLASALSRVQSILGDLNDAQVAEQWLRQRGRRSAGQAFLAGELTAMQRAAADRARRAWPDVWRTAASPKLRSWLA